MVVKNPEWALTQLKHFLWLHELVPVEKPEPHRKNRKRGSLDERKDQSLVVKGIWEAMFGEYPRFVDEDSARRCIFELERGAEMYANLEFEDEELLNTSDLHPWVWEAAKPHWISDNHGAAIWAAGINVNSRMQSKSGVHELSEAKLVQALFSTDAPKPGRPRLRLCDTTNPAKFRDMHFGASQLGSGLYAAIRNPVSHLTPNEIGLSPQEALESLAAFSLFARWVARAELETVDSED